MGDIYWSLHLPLASHLVNCFNLTTAIETGTYFGSGTVHLASLCQQVYTIENDPQLYAFVNERYNQIENIDFRLGHSPSILRDLLPAIYTPTLFVLDAHWFPSSPRADFSSGSQCPILEELKAIEKHCLSKSSSVIMIDDADMFLGSLPTSFRQKDFPSIVKVIDSAMHALDEPSVEVIDDVIIIGPSKIKSVVEEYIIWKDKIGYPLH